MANRNTKLCDISHKIQRNRTASRSIKITEIQMNPVRNSSNKIIVRGNTVACKIPKSTKSTKAQANDELYPTSRSS